MEGTGDDHINIKLNKENSKKRNKYIDPVDCFL